MFHRTLTLVFLLVSSLSLTVLAGDQFITGACAKDADCQSKCCGFKSGKCAGPVIAQERDGGCGFGDAQPNRKAADAFFASMGVQNAASKVGVTMKTVATPAPGNTTAPDNGGNGTAPGNTTTAGSGTAPGTQFITGVCSSDADCASKCCGFQSGKCAGPIIAQERDGGCGFGNAVPNADAANALGARRR